MFAGAARHLRPQDAARHAHCPLHVSEGHAGTCPECHTTFSLLPDCLAARLPGTLAELEDAVATAERSPSVAEAARTLRFGRSEPAGAMRWLRRRIRLVRRALTAVRGLLPGRLAGCAATVLGFRARLGTDAVLPVLPWLREMAAPQLPALPTPLGYAHRVPAVVNRVPTFQQRVDRWAAVGADVRYPDPGPGIDDLFLFDVKRRVMNDRTVSLHGRLYEADAVLVGETVVLRYDPEAPTGRPLQVLHDGKPAGEATVLDAYANTAVRRARPSSRIETDDPAPEPPPSPIAMRDLEENG